MSDRQRSSDYTPFFCEENIWLFAKKLFDEGVAGNQMFVLYFSNLHKSIMLFKQQAAKQGHFIIWDYHVVLQVHQQAADWIYDFDSRLPFPSDISTYFSQTFPYQHRLPEIYRTMIRQIPAAEYLEHFYSDRSHMDARFHKSPDHPVIRPDSSHQPIPLSDYCDMNKQLNDHSLVFNLEDYPGILQR